MAVLLASTLTALVAVPAAVLAAHQFSDVPDTHPFHREISAVAGAGITTGYADGEFKPANPVTRQGMAAFFERGAARADLGEGVATLDAGEVVDVTRATVAAGATQSGQGFVLLQATVNARTTSSYAARCPCPVRLNIESAQGLHGTTSLQVPSVTDSTGVALTSASVQALVPLPADGVQTYRLMAQGLDSDMMSVEVRGTLSATYVPLSGDGDSAQSTTFSCPSDDGHEQNDTLAVSASYYVDHPQTLRAIACPADPDVFRINRTVQAGDRIQAYVDFVHAEGDINVCLLLGSQEVRCATGTSNAEMIDFQATTTGTYFLRVVLAADSGAQRGNPYSIRIVRTPAP